MTDISQKDLTFTRKYKEAEDEFKKAKARLDEMKTRGIMRCQEKRADFMDEFDPKHPTRQVTIQGDGFDLIVQAKAKYTVQPDVAEETKREIDRAAIRMNDENESSIGKEGIEKVILSAELTELGSASKLSQAKASKFTKLFLPDCASSALIKAQETLRKAFLPDGADVKFTVKKK